MPKKYEKSQGLKRRMKSMKLKQAPNIPVASQSSSVLTKENMRGKMHAKVTVKKTPHLNMRTRRAHSDISPATEGRCEVIKLERVERVWFAILMKPLCHTKLNNARNIFSLPLGFGIKGLKC
jgi:hypothetical protein